MLFSEEDAPELKKWIVKRLENTSDADADVLADYVLALLRHDGDVATVRRLCEEEIPDFLKEDSSVFVQNVFDAIQYKSYLPGAPAPQHAPAAATAMFGSQPPGAPTGPQGSRKRSFNERGDGDAQERGFQQGATDPRAFKQPRRGGVMGRGGYNDYGVGRGGYGGRPQSMNVQGGAQQGGYPNIPAMPSPPPGMPPLDPNNPMAAIMAMQAMGFPVPGFPPATSPPPVKKQRCRDYDTKGFCARGNTCMFEHGNDSIFVPSGQKRDEYDPNNARLLPDAGYQLDSRSDSLGIEAPQMYGMSERGHARGRGRGGQRGDSGRRGGRAEFSSDRPNHDRNNTTIVVEQIPEEKFSEDAVREFFSEFGTVSEVSMQAYKRLALVKFEDWNGAQAAYRSPKVIFDNRFVKVYWYKDPESLPQPPGGSMNGATKDANGTPIPVPAREASEPQIDLEEFARKQQEVQKVHEEKQKKKLEMELARKELEKRQEELLKNQAEEKRKLMERIAARSGKSNPSAVQAPPTTGETRSTSQTEALKAQLAALEAEAQSLGIDPSMPDDASWGGRGRGRGRGGYRGRGAFVPRGARGGYRGRGGAPFTGAANAYKLDNRPRKIALTGVDFSSPDKDESLRQYLLGIGEFTDIETTPERTSITFKDRFTAEKFMYDTPGCDIPSVGKVDMAWVQTPLPPVNLAAKAAARMDAENDVAMDEGDAMAAPSSPAQHGNYGKEAQDNLDYDVAGDDDWGVQ
ncbi:RNA recognition domain-containing protein [Phlyctema vagabunda]|uniref:RNA recognition domain-containing protein n=1 Tax=Phlyctema vagabunda TaxID=108571 RepID=A0ABR4P595_9HELO